eukprot:CAMPEP_0113827716 /NCGR_PEP_ID=MMETSP0328-20130328/4906_1 /TAXON_ID=39455 /ORGANISM="Alexandrium minutum" /LENGTH=211 /DNA_ID=CAMNT_0000795705 /DNA_START=89 /DNA_END=721 /DNA_ORIENTATION=- /assembly_acc=CAM_ASM_000350
MHRLRCHECAALRSTIRPSGPPLASLRAVVVVRLVVHHQLAVDEVEAVGAGLPRAGYNPLLHDWIQLWHRVDDLPSVGRVGDDERKSEVEALDEYVPEVVPLDHPEVVQGLVPDGELQGGANRLEVQEGWAEVVADGADAVVRKVVGHAYVAWLPLDLEEHLLTTVLHRPDLERREVDLVDVRAQRAEEHIRRGSQRVDLLGRYLHGGRQV